MHICHLYILRYSIQNCHSSKWTVDINAFTNENKVNNDNACIGGLVEKFAHIWIYQKKNYGVLWGMKIYFNGLQLKTIINK